jgi:Peptidase M50B-like
MSRSSLGTELARILQHQAHLPASVAIVLGVVALGAAALPDIWLLTQHVNSLAHEAAHATVGSILGQRVGQVTIGRDGTGLTTMLGGQRLGTATVAVVGYLGPSLFGLAAAKMIQLGYIVAVLWLALVLLACLLLVVRRLFGLFIVVVSGLLLYVVVAYTSVGAQVMVAYAIAWFLLLSGVLVIRSHGSSAGDAANLRSLTRLPQGFWSILWLLCSLAALVYGALFMV